ncbi:discoidin domain-containing protein [Streptomyces sp. NPDC002514]
MPRREAEMCGEAHRSSTVRASARPSAESAATTATNRSSNRGRARTSGGGGPWYSVLTGRHPTDRKRGVGIYGKYVTGGGYTGTIRSHEAGGPSRNVTLKDFAIMGEITERVDGDQVNAIGGAMTDSVVDNVWMQHTKVGAWMDGPMDNFVIKNSRILDQTADGVNFHTGVTNSRVTNTFVRNSGDDGLAMWADRVPNVNNSFDHNTVVAPILANNIVTYGGKDISITDNVVSDTLTNGGGIHVANRYSNVNSNYGTALAGTHTIARNTLLRAGNADYNWVFGIGAMWFDGANEPINATINVTDTDILDSSYAAVQFIQGNNKTVNFNNVKIDGTGTYMLQVQSGATATFTNVRVDHIGAGISIHSCVGGSWVPQLIEAGNTGWSLNSTVCTGNWPAPNYIYPDGGAGPGGLTGSPGVLSFAARVVGTTSPAQTVTVTNGGASAAPIGSVTVTGDYTQTNTCGTSLAAGASCTVSVTFRPTATGTRTGTLTVPSNDANSPLTVGLSGTATSANPNLAQGRPTTETSHTQTYVSGNAVDGNANTYWEAAGNAFPQSITVDLGQATNIGRIVLKLPPATAWATRSQTIAVTGSTDNATYTSIVAATSYTFNPATGNTATLTFPATSSRYVRLTFSANTGWPAAQLSELEAYAS